MIIFEVSASENQNHETQSYENRTAVNRTEFEQVTSYGELKKMFPRVGTRRAPGYKQLSAAAEIVFSKNTGSGIIEIYENGFFTFNEPGRTEQPTVCAVDWCEHKEAYSFGRYREHGKINVDDAPWEMILEAVGAARLEHNDENRDMSKEEISLDTDASSRNIRFSVLPEHEQREKEEHEERVHKEFIARLDMERNMMPEILGQLKPRQQEVLMLRYGKNLTYEKIGEKMGITKSAARINCNRAFAKAQRLIQKKTSHLSK